MICPWCVDYNDPANDNVEPDVLCIDHLAEYEGMSVVELDRMLAEMLADRL